MPILREKRNWIPLYVILFALIFHQFKKRNGILIVLCALLTVGMSDILSSKIIKPTIERPRPCHTLEDGKGLNLLVNCGGGYSFTSSHATNHFAIGTFLGLVLLPLFKYGFPLFMAWAGSISYAQVYVGVHYPFDVFCGGILGIIIGYFIFRLLRILENKYIPTPAKTV